MDQNELADTVNHKEPEMKRHEPVDVGERCDWISSMKF